MGSPSTAKPMQRRTPRALLRTRRPPHHARDPPAERRVSQMHAGQDPYDFLALVHAEVQSVERCPGLTRVIRQHDCPFERNVANGRPSFWRTSDALVPGLIPRTDFRSDALVVPLRISITPPRTFAFDCEPRAVTARSMSSRTSPEVFIRCLGVSTQKSPQVPILISMIREVAGSGSRFALS